MPRWASDWISIQVRPNLIQHALFRGVVETTVPKVLADWDYLLMRSVVPKVRQKTRVPRPIACAPDRRMTAV